MTRIKWHADSGKLSKPNVSNRWTGQRIALCGYVNEIGGTPIANEHSPQMNCKKCLKLLARISD